MSDLFDQPRVVEAVANDDFYPTPMSVSYKMLKKVPRNAQNFLEPSAGKGNLINAIKANKPRARIDCIESDESLIAILNAAGHTVIASDFLSFDGVSYYDVILMNPPFSNGVDHLLKAWNFMYSGTIVCLLNDETIQNPHTAKRKVLRDIIADHGEVEYLGDVFSNSERKTGVKVSMVTLTKAGDDERLELWADKTTEGSHDAADDVENAIALKDTLGNLCHFYDMANTHMVNAFREMRKAVRYQEAAGISMYSMDEIMRLGLKNANEAAAEFVGKHREAAWISVFNQLEFRKWLDKKQTNEFLLDVKKNSAVSFTKENIKGTLRNVLAARNKLFQKSCWNVFDELTNYHVHNRCHVEGWKSNANYKVNRKIVFPYGCKYDIYSGDKYGWFSRNYGSTMDIHNDLDRVLAVLAGKDFDEVYTIDKAMMKKFEVLGRVGPGAFDNTFETEFFDCKFFKKGTLHITFRDKKLWDLFNVTAIDGKTGIGRV